MIFLSTVVKLSVLLVSLMGLGTTGYFYYQKQTQNEPTLNYDQNNSFYQLNQFQADQLEQISEHHATTWSTISILSDYSNLKVTSNQLKFIQDKLLSPALGFLTSALKVQKRNKNTVYTPKCGNYNVPTQIRAATQPFDLGIIVSGVNSQNSKWWIRGVSCELDSITNRPILGTFEINLAIFNQVNIQQNINEEWNYWYQQTIHELIHLLGFNSVLYPYYVNPDSNVKLGTAAVVRTFFGRQYITLDPVLQRIKKYFNCHNAVGALLEDNGGPDIVGFHWERVTFGNEVMTGDAFPEQVVSEFTLALLEGSGWYKPDYTFAEQFVWGQNQGCLLTQGNCNTVYDEFCKSGGQSGCSNEFKSLSGCYTSDSLASGCNYWREQNDCRKHQTFTDTLSKQIGGQAGAGSACFLTNLPSRVGQANQKSGCFSTKCINNNKSIQFQVGNIDYTCEREGQNVIVKNNNTSGVVTCPNIEKFCLAYQNCPNDCSGQGTCKVNVCKCWNGYRGQDCSIRG